ncbi:ATP-binding cassette domain-containing protein [Paenibacillus sp. 1011MAR3C5]|uniref:ATP-binding cassette domain-containing protein n=1 Tax=Paenibacillus sp. 1011MAR3C5 TaxID=1675787 RepID=UPI000E6CF007|nr:ATP-binding cassette domain-containing protein [Paenibacillus sp. 1011MAR3C5]RJE86840.1 ATP-binding cassette domain-containing protein [Paenibacillus sp. 1011MAR3C5]
MTANWLLDNVRVHASGDREHALLQGVSMRIEAGKIMLLLGHNGAGKSTLLESLAGLRELESGSIRLGDEPLWAEKGKKRLNNSVIRRIGIAMQQSEAQWFASTVREEFAFSLRPYRVDAIAADAHIQAAMSSMGLDASLLDRDPWTLSGGQQRRLAIACLLACEPDWLLLDEPTAGLDTEGIQRLTGMLLDYRASGRGAIVVTHDLEALLPLADGLIIIRDGQAFEAAPTQAALALGAASPQALLAEATLQHRGLLRARSPFPALKGDEGPVWQQPEELARRLAGELLRKDTAAAVPQPQPNPEAAFDDQAEHPEHIVRLYDHYGGNESETLDRKSKSFRKKLEEKFDPRALVAAYLILTTGFLTLNSLPKLAIGAIVAGACITPFRKLLIPLWPIIRGFLYFSLAFIFIGAVSLQPFELQWSKSEPLAIRMFQLWLIMLLGLPLLTLMTPIRLQRGLEQTFGWMTKLRVPIHSLSLLVMLIFRFIPLLMKEWGRFAKIVKARGKSTARGSAIPLRLLAYLFIPYIRAILRMAESMADALEARGFGQHTARTTQGFKLSYTSADGKLLLAAIAACAALLAVRFWL